MIPLRKSTASQEVLLGPFLDDTDGKTAETALTINASDIKLWKRGGTTESNKNSGGATHIADGRYYATLDATDTDTVGELILNVTVAGALPVRLVCCVFEAAVFDSLFASGAAGYQVPIWSSASATVNLSGTTIKAVTDGVSLGSAVITSGSFASGAITAASIAASALNGKGDWQTLLWSSASATVNLSGTTIKAVTDSVAATVADKTGYKLASDGLAAISAWTVAITGNLTGNVTGSVNSVATTVSANVVQWNSGSLPTFPTHFGSLLINSSGHISRVTLVDTTTVNSDMRGTDGAALATHWTSTRAGYLDSVLIAANSNRTVQVTGSNHVAADVHEFQAGVITAADFASGAIDANALATNAAQEIADTILSRALTTAEATAGTISLCTLVLALTGKASVSGGVLTVYRTNGSTVHATIPVASDPNAEPIVGIG